MRLVSSPLRYLTAARISGVRTRNRSIHTTRLVLSKANPNHSPDTYAKDVDPTPASDKTVNRLDPNSESVQRPDEPPSGEWSRAGSKTEEYRHVETGEEEKQPYAPEGGSRGSYGTRGDWAEQKRHETSDVDEGPDANSSGGRAA